MSEKYSIIFEMGDSEDMEMYFAQKGFRYDVIVNIGYELFEVYFFLESTLKYEMMRGGYCAYPGLIILEDITRDNIKIAIDGLYNSGFFDHLKPLGKDFVRYRDKIWGPPAD